MADRQRRCPAPRLPASPFRYFNSSPEAVRLIVMMYVRFPLSLRIVEDLLFERRIARPCGQRTRLIGRLPTGGSINGATAA